MNTDKASSHIEHRENQFDRPQCPLCSLWLLALLSVFICAPSVANDSLPTADGYHGIWYRISAGKEIKYSGGFATYPQQIRPFAIYRKEVNKTFFVYGGTDAKNSTLLHMVSYFDHATGTVPRPRILLDKKTT